MFKFLTKIFQKKPLKKLLDSDLSILNSKVFYYNQLSIENKKSFEKEIEYFLNEVPIYFNGIKKTRLIELLIACSAVIITFGHPFRYKKHITSVTVVDGVVSKNANSFTIGEVRTLNSFKTIFLSEQAIIQGFNNNNDKSNVGIHEFVHILDVADGYMDGIPSVFMNNELIKIWHSIAKNEMNLILKNESTIRAYGAKNIQEFLTVCSEYFFEKPRKLKREHPKVYELLSKTFNQSPIKMYNFKQKANFDKRTKLGRNDQCPCGSGEKYKKCCLIK